MEEIKTPLSLEDLTSFGENSPLKVRTSNYEFLQRFGDRKPADLVDDELITTLSFDKSGTHLAVGDQAGRIVVFQFMPKLDELFEEGTTDQFSSFFLSNNASGHSTTGRNRFNSSFEYEGWELPTDYEFEYVHDFQSHEKDVDFLHNKEVSPQIKNIKWLAQNGTEMRLLSSNSKSIKLWKVKETNDSSSNSETRSFSTKQQQIFYKLHDHSINSLSIALNEEVFLSADDLKINLWHINDPYKPYNLIDLTPVDFDDLSEVITSCNFHPRHDNLFVFGSSEGNIRVGDLRKNGVCDKSCQTLRANHTIYRDCEEYSALVRSLSDCLFLRTDHEIVSRDYLNVFQWDMRNERVPVQVIPIFEPMKGKLGYVYKNEQIFDQFSMAVDPTQRKILTGNYDDSFHLIDLENQRNIKYKLLENDEVNCTNLNKDEKKENFKSWNFENKILKADFHPKKKCLAVACQNCLYLFKK